MIFVVDRENDSMRLALLTRHPIVRAIVLLVLSATAGLPLALASGCSADDVGPKSRLVGGRCITDNDCVKRCVTGSAFPGGYCTVLCTASSDCPGGSACVASNGGVCLATCQMTADCAGYGPNYQCGRQTGQTPGEGPMACAGG